MCAILSLFALVVSLFYISVTSAYFVAHFISPHIV